MTTLSISASKDNDLSIPNQLKNYGADSAIEISGLITVPGVQFLYRPVLEFALATLPENAVIATATLKLYYYSYSLGDPVGKSVSVYKLSHTDWAEGASGNPEASNWQQYKDGVAWSSLGGDYVTSNPSGATTTFPAAYGWMSWDITDIVTDAQANGTSVELLMKATAEGPTEIYNAYFYSRHAGSLVPVLEIQYDLQDVAISFDTKALEQPPVWTNVYADVMSIDVQRGRQDEMNRIETSTCIIELLNTSGNYWPDKTDGDYYPNIKPKKQIQVWKTHGVTAYPIFNGLIESWLPGFKSQQGMKTPIMRLSCVCPMKSLGRYYLNSVAPYPAELSGARIDRILTAFGWAGGRQIDAGQSMIQALDPVTNINALQHIQAVANSEYGQFFFDGEGNAVFHDRAHRSKEGAAHTVTTYDAVLGEMVLGASALGEEGESVEVFETFGNPPGAGEHIYTNINFSLDDQYILNDIRIAITGGTEQVAQDAGSIDEYGQCTYQKSDSLLTTDGEAASEAEFKLEIYKDPSSRVKSIQIIPAADASDLYPLALSYDISDRIRIRLTEAGLLASYFIEGVHHRWDARHPQTWVTEWQLSNYNMSMVGWWILGDPVYGILGSTTKVGF